TGRSPPGCSSAPASSNTTCARSSASLASAAGLSSPGRSARARGPSSPRPEERYGLLLTRVRSFGAHEGVIGAGWDRDLLVPGWGVGDDGRAPSYGLAPGRPGVVAAGGAGDFPRPRPAPPPPRPRHVAVRRAR